MLAKYVGPISAPITSTRTSPAMRLTSVQATTVTELRAVASRLEFSTGAAAAGSTMGSAADPARLGARGGLGSYFHAVLPLTWTRPSDLRGTSVSPGRRSADAKRRRAYLLFGMARSPGLGSLSPLTSWIRVRTWCRSHGVRPPTREANR